ncbi:uncharacterized protein LOC141633420 [Silene latifolia]|uniref:uncharacterized protein LOC141633420 n=1 Tax=Silene latifolia TaxID=37657 RepID=UPI003D77F3F1
MVSGNDPVESLLNSIQVVKDLFSPLEAGFKKATKEFESIWLGSNKVSCYAELLGHLNSSGKISSNKNCKVHESLLRITPSSCTCCEGGSKSPSVKTPIRSVLGVLSPKCGSSDHKVNVMKKRSKERDYPQKDGSCSNCMQFARTWSLFLDGFVQAFHAPFEFGKKRCSKVVDEGKVLSSLACPPSSAFSCDLKKGETEKGLFFMMLPTEDHKCAEGKLLSFELLVGLIFDHLIQNLQKLDHGAKRKEEKVYDSPLTDPSPAIHVDNWKAVTSIIEGKKAYMNDFLGNLNFARVGEVASTHAGVVSPVNEDGDDGETSRINEESSAMAPKFDTAVATLSKIKPTASN